MFNNFKIGTRLGVGFGLTLALLLLIAFIGFTQVKALNYAVDDLVGDKFPKTVQSNEIIDALNIVARSIRNAALVKTTEEASKELDRVPEQSKLITDRIEKLEKTVVSEQGREHIKKFACCSDGLPSGAAKNH